MTDNKTIILQGADGKKWEAPDTAEARKSAADQGFQIVQPDRGLISTIAEGARGLDETISAHPAVNYNPLTWVEHGLLKGVAAIGGAKTDEELVKDTKEKVAKSDTIVAVGPDGKKWEVPNTDDNHQALSKQGFKVLSADDLAKQATTEGPRGATKAYLENVGNEMGFGVPKIAESEQGKADFKALNDEHPYAAGAGTVAGIAANMSTPGLNLAGVAGKAEKVAVAGAEHVGIEGTSLLGKMAQGAAKHAAAGAVYSAPRATAEAIFDDPAKAGESMAIGIGLGAVMGGASPLLGKIPDAIRNGYKSAGLDASVKELSDSTFNKMIGMQKGSMKAMGDDKVTDIADVLKEAGINSPAFNTKAKILENIEALKQKSGETIGKTGELMDEVVAKHPEDIKTFGFNLSNVVNSIDEKMVPQLNAGLKSNRSRDNFIVKLLDDSINIAYGKEAAAGIKTVADAQEALTSLPSLTFKQGQTVKSFIGDKAALGKRWDLLTDNEMVARKIYGAVSGELENAIDRTATQLGNPELLATYQTAKRQYAAIKTIEDHNVLENLSATAHGNKFFGLTNNIAITGAIGTAFATGSPIPLLAPAVKMAYESTPAQSFLVKALDGMNMNFRAVTAEAVTKRFDALDKLAGGATAIGARLHSDPENKVSPMAAVIGSKETDHVKAYQAFRDTVTPLVSDPQKLQAKFEPMMNAIASTGDHDAAMHYMAHQTKAIQYLHDQMPKPPLNPALFLNREYVPSAKEIAQFNDQCAAAMDPFYIVRKIEQGQLNKAQLDTVKTLFPEISQLIAARIKTMGYEQQLKSNQPNLPYSVRYRMQQLSDALGDPSMAPQKAAALQANFQAEPAPQQGKIGAGKAFGKANEGLATKNSRLGFK